MGLVTLVHRSDHLHCALRHSLEATLALLSAAHQNREACRCSPVSFRAPESRRSLHHCILVPCRATLVLLFAEDLIGVSVATVWVATKRSKRRTKACSLWKRKMSLRAHRESPQSLPLGFFPERANLPLDPLVGKELSKRNRLRLDESPVNYVFAEGLL
jgi:hypothetical protein